MLNGSTPVLSGVAAPRQPRPVVGHVRARVAYPLEAPATIVGPFGRAWLCDLQAARQEVRANSPDAMIAHWVVEAPWSHEVVHSYSLVLLHLRYILGKEPSTKYLEGATHQLNVHPIHPSAPRVHMLKHGIDPTMWLRPRAFAAQFVGPSDDAAAERVQRAADLVCQGRLSPHYDHARSWAELFGDNMLRHAAAPKEE